MKTLVAIVGRPNVGKSTLFNRMTGVRRAIVDVQPGSTRDRNLGRVEWAGKSFEVVDTGGIQEKAEGELERQVEAQCEIAIEEAKVICWMVDGRAGLLPDDLAIAHRLRSHSERVLLLVNKLDQPERIPAEALEFYRLGFPQIFEISAEHGLGVAEVLDEIARRVVEKGALSEAQETRIAIVGRPNVGKSSLLNSLAGKARAVVSPRAGTTRDAIDTLIRRGPRTYRIVDTAGIRKRGKLASRADELSVLYAERAIDRAHICLLVLDATEGVTRQDASIGAKIATAGRGAVLVFNKWDLVESRARVAEELKKEAERLKHLEFAPRSFVSALSGKGVSRLLPLVDRVREQQIRRIPTPQLNRLIGRIIKTHPPRARDGREVKIYYALQTGTAPPRFAVFSNVKAVDPAYLRYLTRRLREEYGFEGTPLKVSLRQRR
jgi:GTP-binding protein